MKTINQLEGQIKVLEMMLEHREQVISEYAHTIGMLRAKLEAATSIVESEDSSDHREDAVDE